MPPFSTIFLLILTGFCLFTAVYFFIFYFMMVQKNHDRLAFAFVALFGSGFAYTIMMTIHAPDVETFRQSLLWYLGFFQPTFLCVLWFTAFYTGSKPKGFLWAMTGATFVFMVLHTFSPYGLLTSGIGEFSTQRLPWGEDIVLTKMVPSAWVFPWYSYLYIGLGYCAVAGWRYVRSSGGKAGKGFLFCIAISFFAGFNNLLVDLGRIPGPYLSELSIVAFIIFMTVDLALEWRSQELFFGEVFDAQNDGIFIHDAETGDVIQVNEATRSMYRAEQADLLGKNAECMISSDPEYSVERAKALIGKTLTEGPQVFEWKARRMDGTSFWVEVALRAATLVGRKRVIAVIRDITERRQSEESLREGEKRFRNVVEASPVGMQFFHLEADDRLVFKGANLAADRILKTEHSALVGKSLEEAFPALRNGEIPARYRHTAKTGEPWRTETLQTHEGRIKSVYEVFVAQTEPDSVVAMFLDVTERRKMDQERLRVEIRMQEAQRLESLGMMAGGVAHDFNNILMAIKGNVEVLERKGNGLEEAELFSDIGTSIQRAAELCHQLLAYAGRNRLLPEALDLRQVVRETGKVVGAGGSKKAAFEFRFPETLPKVQGDATQIRQVVLNLMMNAVESLGEAGGRVTVALRTETLERPTENMKPGTYVFLEVIDTGCGMSDEVQSRIFEPFFTTKFTGRGLGLAAVQGILRSHNGAIHVRSRAGKGTTMSVILPALAGKAAVPSKVKASLVAPFTSAERFCGRALLVDDEEDVRRVTRRMLERLGIEVVEAAEGKQGLGIFQKEGDSFVGVLLDLTMPEMDGLETYQRLLSMRPGLQALLVSGYGMEEMKDRLREYPGMALVQKPFGQKELSKALMGIGWPLAALPSDSEEFRRAEEVYLSMLGILMDESRDAGSFFEGLGTLWAQLPGIRFAWAGGLDETGERILPVAESTRSISGVVRFGFMGVDSPWSQGPAGSALRSGQPIVLNEMDKDPESAPWRESAIRAGFGSAAVFPLKVGELVVGMWHLYAFERGYFDYHRVAFFEEAAGLLAKGFQKFQKPTV